MRFLLDENVPDIFARRLREIGHDVVCIKATAPGIGDAQVWELSNRSGRICVTFDKDFGQIAKSTGVLPRTGVILLRLHKGPLAARAERLVEALGKHDGWNGQFAVVEEESIRFRAFGPIGQKP